MLTFLASIAFINLGIGFYVGTYWILPITVGTSTRSEQQQLERPDQATENHPHAAGQSSIQAADDQAYNAPDQITNIANSPDVPSTTSAKHSWQAAASSARTDIAMMNDRISYAFTANDKQMVKDLTANIRSRSRMWQKQMQDLLAQLTAEHEQDASAMIDLVTPELCLAQIETVQTNLDLLDWSEASETILDKLHRELASINKLLPVSG